MTAWTEQELTRIGEAGELRIAGTRTDGSRRNPVIIWGVRVGDDFFVRSVSGVAGGWYKGTRATHEGWISSGGVEKDVVLQDVAAEEPIQEQIDAAYRAKYGSGRSVQAITNATARQATLRVAPR